MKTLENVSIKSVRADYLKRRITLTLSTSILEMDADTRNELVRLAENSNPISLDFEAMPDPQAKLAL